MFHHVKGCLEDITPDEVIIHHGTNDLHKNISSEDIADNIVEVALSTKSDIRKVYVSSIIMRNDKWKDKAEKVNESLIKKCEINDLIFKRKRRFIAYSAFIFSVTSKTTYRKS